MLLRLCKFLTNITYHKLFSTAELFLNLFAQVTIWHFEVLSGFSIVIHQSQEAI